MTSDDTYVKPYCGIISGVESKNGYYDEYGR